jgi:hypothetical protein
MILRGSAAVRVPGGDVPDLGQQALRQRGGREPEREEVVVADGETAISTHAAVSLMWMKARVCPRCRGR